MSTDEPSPSAEAATAYRLAYEDVDFMQRDELRAVRLQLELLKAELIQRDLGIRSTVVIFGSARIPEPVAAKQQLQILLDQQRAGPTEAGLADRIRTSRRLVYKSRYYEEARLLARLITEQSQGRFVITTGGGPGIMEAANRGAAEAGGLSIGMNIALPVEQVPNPYITPELRFQFHYFALRKMHFMLRAKALVAFPGGYGTLDELFETLTLVQTHKVRPIPILLFGRSFWDRILDFNALVDEAMISPEERKLVRYVERAEEAWRIIRDFYGLI